MYCKSAQRCRGVAVNADHLPDAILIQQFTKVEVIHQHKDSEGLGLNVPLGPRAGAEAVIE